MPQLISITEDEYRLILILLFGILGKKEVVRFKPRIYIPLARAISRVKKDRKELRHWNNWYAEINEKLVSEWPEEEQESDM